MLSWLALLLLVFGLVFGPSCGGGPFQPLGEVDESRIKTELEGRSFRQFEPHVEGNPRRGAIIDFTGGLSLWAQYAKDGHAVNEWEITSSDYRIEKRSGEEAITVHFSEPMTRQQFPEECEGCIETTGVSISVRNVYDSERMALRVNDPDGVLPLPFPVFGSWTTFREDEYFD